jgi:trans-AT polyketide synthase/acyltransferase/oxidoreductase domain-containing protein
LTTLVFPGQGSQYVGMGKNLFENYPQWTRQADTLLGYSLTELCLNDPRKQLHHTSYTQPALYVVNALSYLHFLQDHPKPQFVAGHSLGEYNALLTAQVFDFETGLKLVQKRSTLMANAPEGKMAAILGLSAPEVQAILKEHHFDQLEIANYNSPSQLVLSGASSQIEQAQSVFKKYRITYIPLKVSGAFHSTLMENARKEFEIFLNSFTFQPPQIPVLSNVTATPYPSSPSENLKKLLAQQLNSPVRWSDTLQFLHKQGEKIFIEIGPGQVLTKLLAQNPPLSESLLPSSLPSCPLTLKPESLGSSAFRKEYHCKYAYISGAMYKGIGSKEIVVAMGKAKLLGFLGTGGLKLERIEKDIQWIQSQLSPQEPYGMNLLCNLVQPELEEQSVALYLRYHISVVEAAAYMQMTPSLVWYRLKGIHLRPDGSLHIPHRIIAKISRPEVAEIFMSPPPPKLLQKLLETGQLTPEEAKLGSKIPMAQDICAEADSGGHTDQRALCTLIPAISLLRDTLMRKYEYPDKIRVGAAGGIGTPESAAAAFIMGADFILTGSINQCSVEAGTSVAVKEMLQEMNIQDTTYAPAGDMFEIGAKVQVLRKGLFFPARANKLYELYRQYNTLEEIDEKTRQQIQEKYFQRSFEEVWEETKAYYLKNKPSEIERAEQSPKHKMALLFRWYFIHTNRLALQGSETQRVDYQIHCGHALGAFNQWVKGTLLESWKNRHVDEIAEKLMTATALVLQNRFDQWLAPTPTPS